MRLITKEQYDQLPPYAQGYTVGIQANLEGSPLKDLINPFDSEIEDQKPSHDQWNSGKRQAENERLRRS